MRMMLILTVTVMVMVMVTVMVSMTNKPECEATSAVRVAAQREELAEGSGGSTCDNSYIRCTCDNSYIRCSCYKMI